MAAPYLSYVDIKFRHCDPAGIVFYPRYFEMINDFVEEWFDKGLGFSFHTLHTVLHIGTPTASIQCDFTAPSRWQECLRQILDVERIGGASLTVQVRFEGADGQLRLRSRITLVLVDLHTMKATALPEGLHARLHEFLLTSADENV